MSAYPATICRAFVATQRHLLQESGAELALVLVDENASKRKTPLKHGYAIAKRQARIAGCSTANSLARILCGKLATRLSSPPPHEPCPPLPPDVRVISVPSLNSPAAIKAVVDSDVDLICLMGTRILTAATLNALNRPAINIHSSDPRFMRGSQSISCEILDNRDSIILTIHEVLPQLDSGNILLQKEHPIRFCGGIGATLAETSHASIPVIARLFSEAILGLQSGKLKSRAFTPGPLKVTLSIPQMLRLELICRQRTRTSCADNDTA